MKKSYETPVMELQIIKEDIILASPDGSGNGFETDEQPFQFN